MRYFGLILCFLLVASSLTAQTGRQHRPLYQLGGKYSPNGWNFALGGTYMLPNASQRSETERFFPEQGSDTLFTGNFDAAGKLGLYLEVGRHHFVEDPKFVHYFDYGINFKMLRGSESFNGMVNNGDSLVNVTNSGTFSNSFVSIHGNMNHIVQVSDRSFVQLSLGANVDYRVINNIGPENAVGAIIPQEFAGPLQAQLHGKIGYGFRLESGRFIIPSIETPILNVHPFYDGKSTLPYFSTRYRPIIFSIRFLFLSHQKAGDCVGKGTEKRGQHLWGKDMRK